MTLICMKMKLHVDELIFIWKVSHLESFGNRGTIRKWPIDQKKRLLISKLTYQLNFNFSFKESLCLFMCQWAVLWTVYSSYKWCDFDIEHCMSELYNTAEPSSVTTLWNVVISSPIYDYLKVPKIVSHSQVTNFL